MPWLWGLGLEKNEENAVNKNTIFLNIKIT